MTTWNQIARRAMAIGAVVIAATLCSGVSVAAQNLAEVRLADSKYRYVDWNYTWGSGVVVDVFYIGVPGSNEFNLGGGYTFKRGPLVLTPLIYAVLGREDSQRGVKVALLVAFEKDGWKLLSFAGSYLPVSGSVTRYQVLDTLDLTRTIGSRWDAGIQSGFFHSNAKLRYPASLEDVDFSTPRGLSRDVVLSLGTGGWIRDHHNLLMTGPTGIGKSWLASAFVQSACRHGFTATYVRAPRLLPELAVSRGDGSYARLLAKHATLDLLAIDDWLLAPLTDAERRDLLEVIEDRSERASTLIASQLPPTAWHAATVSGTTVWRWLAADAIRPWRHRRWLFPRDPAFAA